MNSLNIKHNKLNNNNDPWAILIALASLIIIATGISIVAICLLWEKYKNNRIYFEHNLNAISYDIPQNMIEERQKEYEIQVFYFLITQV